MRMAILPVDLHHTCSEKQFCLRSILLLRGISAVIGFHKSAVLSYHQANFLIKLIQIYLYNIYVICIIGKLQS